MEYSLASSRLRKNALWTCQHSSILIFTLILKSECRTARSQWVSEEFAAARQWQRKSNQIQFKTRSPLSAARFPYPWARAWNDSRPDDDDEKMEPKKLRTNHITRQGESVSLRQMDRKTHTVSACHRLPLWEGQKRNGKRRRINGFELQFSICHQCTIIYILQL